MAVSGIMPDVGGQACRAQITRSGAASNDRPIDQTAAHIGGSVRASPRSHAGSRSVE
jgi:hypothetical protein